MTKQINYYDDRGKVRNKIGIWLGSNTHQAVIHTIKELTSNSGDLLLEGVGSKIIWTIYDNKTVEIYDDCTGLPIEGETRIRKQDIKGKETFELKSNYELLLLTLFAGTKHNGLATGEANTGTNGVFNTVLTYSSDTVEYEIGRPNGNIYYCSFKEGFVDKELQVIGKTNKTYTRIKYKLSDQVYTENYFAFEEICDICKKQSALLGKPITIIDKKHNKEKTYDVKNIESLFEKYLENKQKDNEVISITDKFSEKVMHENKEYMDNMTFKLLFSYTKEEDSNLNTDFLNRSELIHHGTIYEGVIDGLKKSFHKFISNQGLYIKKENNISKDDILCGLNYIIDFTSLHPNMYSNQTKFETKIKYFKTHLIESIYNYFEVFSIENHKEMMNIANKILLNKRSREKAEVNRSKIKKELEEKVTSATNRPPKFVPCRSKDPKEVELIIIEGESAKNCILSSRDSKFMCVYPLKGKPMNVLKKNIDAIMNNNEIKDIFKILNCGVTYKGKNVKGMPTFNINNLQVDKILITTDRDVDGCHIESLLVGIFYTLAPELLKQGKVYILYTPLYVIKTKNEEIYAYTEEERNNIVKNLNCKFKETRYKGLGGLPTQVMSKTAMDIENRKIKQITWLDIEKGLQMLELCLSDDKDKERKEYIETFGHKFFDYSLLEG